MRFPRSSGILLHPTSLPGPNGIGQIGPEAFRFADLLSTAGQKIWQVLPLGLPGTATRRNNAFPRLPEITCFLASTGWLIVATEARRRCCRGLCHRERAACTWESSISSSRCWRLSLRSRLGPRIEQQTPCPITGRIEPPIAVLLAKEKP
jgi:hypothetical protein